MIKNEHITQGPLISACVRCGKSYKGRRTIPCSAPNGINREPCKSTDYRYYVVIEP